MRVTATLEEINAMPKQNGFIFSHYWAMPNKNTFTILPIKELLEKYVKPFETWIDPMAGNNSPATLTNDINPHTSSWFHMDALDFVNTREGLYDGALFDPPYSPRQVKEMYDGFGGKKIDWDGTMKYYSKLKDALANILKSQSYAISFGWNSNGFGKNRGFETIEIMLVKHGGWHNDTIVTVERKA